MKLVNFLHQAQVLLAFHMSRTLGFHLASTFRRTGTLMRHVSNQGLKMKLDIVTRDFELTPTIKDKVEDKIGKTLSKFRLPYVSSHVVLRLHKFPDTEMHSSVTKKDSQIAEITVNVKGGKTIHISERSEDMYASIDMLHHKLQRMLSKFKGKLREKGSEGIDYSSDEVDESTTDLKTSYSDVMDDKLAGQILKEKAFEMPAMSAAEAAENLEFIDHPFYVFRNKETNEVNVLYKRKEGGMGIIMPKK